MQSKRSNRRSFSFFVSLMILSGFSWAGMTPAQVITYRIGSAPKHATLGLFFYHIALS